MVRILSYGSVSKFVLPVLVVGVAAALRIWPLQALGSTLVWLTFYPAVMVSAVYGGFYAGLFATGLAVFVAIFLWRMLVATPYIHSYGDWLGLGVFVFTGTMISVVSEGMLRANARAKLAQEKAEEARNVASRANLAKSQFLATMSHELRTPLNTIIGMAYLLRNTRLDQEQREEVDAIHASGNSLLALINDILDISKIEAGELVIEARRFSLQALLDEVRRTFAIVAEKKHLELNIPHLGPEFPDKLEGDDNRLRQILLNLFSNAIKFTEQGCVRLAISIIAETSREDRVRLRFEVTDTGIGISPEVQTTLFQPFVQGDNSITRRFGGTGLGLSIVKRVSEGMGGAVGLTSIPGEGSTFWVELPFKTCAESVDLSHKDATMPALHVLVAVDEECDRQVLMNIANCFGWRAESVDSLVLLEGKVVERMQEHPPLDCILLDWRLPKPDGVTVLAELRKKIGEPRMPSVVLVTGQENNELIHAASEIRPDAMLTRPVQHSALFNAVNEAMFARGHGYDHVLNATVIENDHSQWLSGVKVLVVDDSRMNLDVCQRILSREDATVELAESGEEAVNRFRQAQATPDGGFDIVLMDLRMPGMDGFEATRLIRLETGAHSLPVIALTAEATITERERAKEAEFNDFLTKPIDPSRLIRVLRHHVEIARGKPLPVISRDEVASPDHEAQWPSVEGVEAARASEIVGGDREFFLDLLGHFVDEHAESAAKIRELLEDGQARAGIGLVHKIKGQAGNLGALQLYTAAGALQDGIEHDAADRQVLLAAFEQAHARLISSAKNRIKHEKDTCRR